MKSGVVQTFPKGQVFYALDFKEELYVVNKGYVKRYAVTKEGDRVIESIYGPGYFFPLSTIYKNLLNLELSQEGNTYIYQAMTDLEIQGIGNEALATAVEESPEIYADLFYESGRRLRANVNRLASNALKDDYRKITHQLAYLADEFGVVEEVGVRTSLCVPLPLEPIDMAEQLNVSLEVTEAIMSKLEKQGLIKYDGRLLSVPDINLLKDAFMQR